MNRFILHILVWFSMVIPCFGATVNLSNLDPRDFTTNGTPPATIGVKLRASQFSHDSSGITIIDVTGVPGSGGGNLYTHLTATPGKFALYDNDTLVHPDDTVSDLFVANSFTIPITNAPVLATDGSGHVIASGSGYTGTGSKVFRDNGAFSIYALADPLQYSYPLGGDAAVTYSSSIITNMLSGTTNILFTVPVGKKCWLFGSFFESTNTTSVSISSYLRHAGYDYRLSSDTGVGTTTNTPSGFNSFGIRYFDAGDIIAITNSAPVSAYIMAKLIDDTTAVKVSRLYDFVNTPTLMYTVPANTLAVPIPSNSPTVTPFGTMYYTITQGTNIWYKLYIVPSGALPDDSTLYARSQKTSTANTAFTSAIPILFAGTSVYVESSTSDAGQMAFFEYFEMTVP